MKLNSLWRTIAISIAMVFFVNLSFSQQLDNEFWLYELAVNSPDSFRYVNKTGLSEQEKILYKAHQWVAKSKLDSAISNYFVIKENYQEDEDFITQLDYYIGVTYSKSGNYHLGSDFLFKAQKRANDNGLIQYLPYIHEQIGDNFFMQEQFENALQQYATAKELYENIGGEQEVAWIYNKMGKAYLGLDDVGEAEQYFDEAILLFEELGDKEGIVSIFGSVAWSNFKEGDLYQARRNCYHSLRENIALGNQRDEMDALYLLGKIEFQEENLKNAEQYFIDAFDMALKLKELKHLRDLSFDLYKLYSLSEEYKKANEYLATHLSVKDKLIDKEQSLAMQQLSATYEFEKQQEELDRKNQEISLLKENERFQNQRTIALVGLVFLLAIIGVLVTLRQRQKRQKQIEITEKEKELAESKKALIEAELKSTQWESQELKNRLAFKNKELQNFALHIVEKNEFLQDLNSDLAKLNAVLNDNESKALLKETRSKISYNLSLEKDRTEFQNYVEQVNEEFFLRLVQQFPTITDTEKRLAALLRMNLSSKEISTIMNITPKSVDMNRYRLRKKFEIEKDTSLYDFISEI